MPELTRTQQQHVLAQQAFIWIRLVMNFTLTDLHPACKRLFQCRYPEPDVSPHANSRRQSLPNIAFLCVSLYAPYADHPRVVAGILILERQSRFPYRCWSGSKHVLLWESKHKCQRREIVCKVLTVLSRRTCRKSLMRRALIADFSAAIADCYFRSQEKSAIVPLCFC